MRPPESPRREGKRREDEDYFVIEVKSRLLVLSQRLTSRRCRSIAILGAPIAILCWESLNLAFLLMRKNWHRGGRKRGTLSSSSTWSMSPPASQSLCHSSHTPTFWGISGVCGFFLILLTQGLASKLKESVTEPQLSQFWKFQRAVASDEEETHQHATGIFSLASPAWSWVSKCS